MRHDEGAQGRRVAHKVAGAPKRGQWPSRRAVAIREGDPDALLPEVDTQDPAHGLGAGEADSILTASLTVRSTRPSIVGTVVTQSGHA